MPHKDLWVAVNPGFKAVILGCVAVTAGGLAHPTDCADRASASWVSCKAAPWILSCVSFVFLTFFCFFLWACVYFPLSDSLRYLPTPSHSSICLLLISRSQLFPLQCIFLSHSPRFSPPQSGYICGSLTRINLLFLTYNTSRQSQLSNFLTWMLMTAVWGFSPGCGKLTLKWWESVSKYHITFYCLRIWNHSRWCGFHQGEVEPPWCHVASLTLCEKG